MIWPAFPPDQRQETACAELLFVKLSLFFRDDQKSLQLTPSHGDDHPSALGQLLAQ
jgi:hypothetical protein